MYTITGGLRYAQQAGAESCIAIVVADYAGSGTWQQVGAEFVTDFSAVAATGQQNFELLQRTTVGIPSHCGGVIQISGTEA